jgi:hypothetical protein
MNTARIPTHLLSLLLMMTLLLAACGGQPSAPPAAEEPAATSAPDTEGITGTEATTDTETITETEPITETGAEPVPEAPAEEPPAEGSGEEPLHTDALQFGVVAHLYYTDRERTLTLANNAGFDWVRQQVAWKDTEGPAGEYAWDELDLIVEAVNAHNLKLLISVVQAPSFYTADGSNGMPEDPATLGTFMEAMALRYGDQIHAYEIWNEQNLAHETGGRIVPEDAGRYVEMLMESYTRIKAVNPDAFILAGAPSSSNFTREDIALADLEYYRLMYEYKDGIIDGYFDVQAVHPGGSANPPDTLWPDNPSDADGWTDDPTFYFRHIENVRAVMEEYGMADHDVWITEYGWATENETPGYEFGNQVSFEEQGAYIARAMERTYEEYPWVGNMFLWNLNFAVLWGQQDPPQPLHEQASFAILNPDWSPRPSFDAVQATIARLKQEQGR